MDFALSDIAELFWTGEDADLVLMLVWILPVILFVFYGQRIQLTVTARDIRKSISELEALAAESRSALESRATELGAGSRAGEIEAILDYFEVPPVSMDPAGLVRKVRHIVRSKEDHVRMQVSSMAPDLGETGRAQLQAMIEASAGLRIMHRVVRHLYLTAKRQNNYPLILPLQMMLPFAMEEARAMRAAVSAFALGQPIGDGIGPMVVGAMMKGSEKKEAAFETVYCTTEIGGRKVHLIKARGPLASVGRPGEAVQGVIAREGAPDVIITVDAALKMEGEESGSIARGFGVAMGGIGVERYAIEQVASECGIPLLALVAKQSIAEALSLMDETIAKKSGEMQEQVREMVMSSAAEGRSAIVVGVGNTAGVLQ